VNNQVWPTGDERRRSSRIPWQGHLRVLLPGGAAQDGRGQDLSFAGMSCLLPHPLEPGQVVSLRFDLPLPRGGRQRARAQGRVRHCRALRSEPLWRTGFEFLHLDPASARALYTFLALARHGEPSPAYV